MPKNSVAEPKRPSKLSVYLYIPNLVGYTRILLNCVAFYISFSNKKICAVLYFLSFVCDGVDGWCARRFNQVSTFGAVLDMVTDRISTACLLLTLAQAYRNFGVLLILLALDIGSHWFQMVSSNLAGKASHKDVKDSTSRLFRLYYTNRMFMGYCCVACEVLYILLFLLAESRDERMIQVLISSAKQDVLLCLLIALSLFGWGVKQAVNLIQWKTAADVCVLYDIEKKQ